MTIASSNQEYGDPRLTAYALGEMSESDRAAFERELDGDETARAEIEAIRAFAADVESTLAVPAEAGLDDVRREAVHKAAAPRLPMRWIAVAAVALFAVGLGVVLEGGGATFGSLHPVKEVAGAGPERAPRAKEPWPDSKTLFEEDAEEVSEDLVRLTIGDGTTSSGRRYGNPGGAAAPMQPPEPGSGGGAAGFSQSSPWDGSSAGGAGGGHSQAGGRGVAGSGHAGPGVPAGQHRFGDDGRPGIGSPDYRPGASALPLLPATSSITVGGETYPRLHITGYLAARKHHTSTFSIDVDTASYANVRRFLTRGSLPPPNAVRLEEMINYFDYDYAPPEEGSDAPFRTHVQVAQCPWAPTHRLARIGLKGRVIAKAERPAANLVFLVDVSGSMAGEDKLPLLKTGLEMMTEKLEPRDQVGIVTYAGQAGVALETTPGSNKETILGAIRGLRSGGSTNGEAGIQVAYDMAVKAKGEHTVNRVILCTDGDFNVGTSDTGSLVRMIETKAQTGVFLSILGFGTGNYKDAKMEALSNKGNGNYAYIDGQKEAKRVLVEQMSETLVTIAKDVKVQVFFNPKRVRGYRLLGYENRRLAARDFNDDKKDAGEIGAGHAVTALYEIVPTGLSLPGGVDPNPFVENAAAPAKPESEPDEKALFRLRLRWKAPEGETSSLIQQDVVDEGLSFEQADRSFQWAASVAGYGMLLRRSPYASNMSWELVSELAQGAKGEDPKGRRGEFLGLVAKAKSHFQR